MNTVASLDELLDKYHLDLSSADVLAEMDAALAAVPGYTPLSAGELTFLAEQLDGAAEVIDGWHAGITRRDQALLALRNLNELIAGSVSVPEAAAMLGIDRSGVSRRISNSALASFELPGRRRIRIPRWQFMDRHHLLPGLDLVVPAIPGGVDPLTTAGFMGTPQAETGGRTPAEYLARGGDPSVVAELVADLDRW